MTDGRMELNHIRVDTTPPSSGRSTPNRIDRDTTASGRNVISLRKYTPAICILEALAIISFIVYIYFFTDSYNPLPSSLNDRHEIYRNISSETVILLDLVEGCTMRKYDMKHGVKCQSNNIYEPSCRIPGKSVDGAGELYLQRPFMVVSSKSGARLERNSLDYVYCEPSSSACNFRTKLIIEPHIEYQPIIGWGGALTDSSINVILGLTTNGTKRLLDDYFGEDGLKFNMIRITIGGSDFSSRLYTNDDTNRTEDLYLRDFKLREEDYLYKIPMLKYIISEYSQNPLGPRGGIKLFASMWSPPLWMKTNHHFNKGFLKGSLTNVSPDQRYFEALAQLKKKFLFAYFNEKINFWGLTVMNEPLWAIQPFIDFNTMIFPKEDYAYYVAQHLGPALKKEPIFSHIKIMAHDDNRRYLLNYTDPILQSKAWKYIDGVSTHGYVDEEYHLMEYIAKKYRQRIPGFFVLPTELSSGHLPFMEKALVGNWHRGIHYGLDIIRGLQHWAAGWVDWNMALDTTGGPGWLGGRLDSPIIVDKDKDLYYKNPMFYAIGHFSRYIPPGSVRVETRLFNGQYDYQLETVTFMLPNRQNLTTVILNNNPYPIEVYLDLPRSLTPKYNYRIVSEADSITTVVYPIMEVCCARRVTNNEQL